MSLAHLSPDRPDLKSKEYLGDGAYVGMRGVDVDLWTTDGVRVTNQIVLEPSVLRVFIDWIRQSTLIEGLKTKEYLGGGAYVSMGYDGHVDLRTTDANRIILEPWVLQVFLGWIRQSTPIE